MQRVECEFEAEVAAAQPRWPDHIEPSLREHVAGCAICRETALVARLVAASAEEARQAARPAGALPDAGAVWWRAQLRARREAAAAAGRPITVMHMFALACAAGLAGACFGATSEWFQAALGSGLGVWRDLKGNELVALAGEHGMLALAVLTLMLAVPAVLCWAAGRD